MSRDQFKREVFLHLLNGTLDQSIEDIISYTRRLDAELHDEQIELEDLREGPYNNSFEDSLKRVAFELKNNEDTYQSWRIALSRFVYEEGAKTPAFNIEKQSHKSILNELSFSCADRFLHELIKDVLKEGEQINAELNTTTENQTQLNNE